MRNYWLDRIYSLAVAISDFRRENNAITRNILGLHLHIMAVDLLEKYKQPKSEALLDRMEKAAWSYVDRFDLKRKDKAVVFFVNVMKNMLMLSIQYKKNSVSLRKSFRPWKGTP